MFLVTFFIIIQVSLLFIMALHDWVEIKPLTDIFALARAHSVRNRIISSLINSITVLIPLSITLWYRAGIPRLRKLPQ